MSVLLKRFWREPAVAFGVLVAVALLVVKIIDGGAFTADDIASIAAPIAAAIGIRQAVTPKTKGA